MLNTDRFRRRTIAISLLALVVVFILWNMQQLDFITYPLRLFVTYIHEAGHSSMALLTGGKVLGFTVSPNGSGLATRAGGIDWLVIPAGYLGAAFFGAALFYLTNRLRYTRFISWVLGIGMVIFTVLFARPTPGGAITALAVGILFGLGLMLLAWKANRDLNQLVLSVLAIMTALNGVLDLWYLIQHSGIGLGTIQNDAASFSQNVMPLIPPAVIAIVWALLAVLMLAASVYWSMIRPVRRRKI